MPVNLLQRLLTLSGYRPLLLFLFLSLPGVFPADGWNALLLGESQRGSPSHAPWRLQQGVCRASRGAESGVPGRIAAL